jgi:hypothetical protein
MERNDRVDRAGSARRASRKDMASDREWVDVGDAAMTYGLLVYALGMRGQKALRMKGYKLYGR